VTVHIADLDVPSSAPWRIAAGARRLSDLVRRIGPDLVHSHFVGTTLTMRAALGRSDSLPRVFQVAGPLHLGHRLFRALDLSTASPADRWIGSCQWTCDAYRSAGIPAERVFLSYYGVDLDPHDARPAPVALPWPAGGPVVGMVAYMYAPKWYLG